MKVLLLNQAFYPDSVATSQYVTDLAKYLVAQGHEVSVLCDRRDYTQRDRIYPAYEVFEGIQIYRLPSTGLGKRNYFARFADAITYELCTLWKLVERIPRHDAVIAFEAFPLHLKAALRAQFPMDGRNRRPPRDALNCLVHVRARGNHLA